jgi:pyruvate,orthophosphate dikinase
MYEQVRAIIEAALNVKAEGVVSIPEIMVPLVGTVRELEHQVTLIRRVASAVFGERKDSLAYRVGTMIEIPRAALLAKEIAKVSLPQIVLICLANSCAHQHVYHHRGI